MLVWCMFMLLWLDVRALLSVRSGAVVSLHVDHASVTYTPSDLPYLLVLHQRFFLPLEGRAGR